MIGSPRCMTLRRDVAGIGDARTGRRVNDRQHQPRVRCMPALGSIREDGELVHGVLPHVGSKPGRRLAPEVPGFWWMRSCRAHRDRAPRGGVRRAASSARKSLTQRGRCPQPNVRAPGAILGCAGYGGDSAKEGNPTMATAKLSDEALLAFFQDHAELRERMASLVATVGNAAGNLEEADAAEERLVEEMRLLGRAAMRSWADERVVATEREVRLQAGMHRQGKKNCSGTRSSAR